tara:strand:- start:143 stop:670 length:528 start_codon:yes stop_codon:yes gene_type:complete
MTRLIGLYSHAPGCGKSTVARMLDGEIVSFAAPLKRFVTSIVFGLGHDGFSAVRDHKEDKIPEIGVSPRQMMQTLGTEWGRSCVHPNLWEMLAESQAKGLVNSGFSVVFDDVRFPNEAEMIRRLGGELWLVNRPGVVYEGNHASEGALSDVLPDAVINNSGSRDELRAIVAGLLE